MLRAAKNTRIGSMITGLFTIGVLVDVLVFSNLERRIRKRYGLVDAAAPG